MIARVRELLSFADLVVDLGERTATREGQTVALTRLEFEILVTLLRHPGRVFTREEILDSVWGGPWATQRAVDTCVVGLRKKIDAPFEVPLLHTIRGVGFSLRRPRKA
ncbi:MAG: winged helix-turn-helix domain-containing protein [Candidatus Aquilonibacter sp.]